MRKQANNHFRTGNTGLHQSKESKKNASVKKNPRYIYTEDDLGEGILDVGIISPFTGKHGNHAQPAWN